MLQGDPVATIPKLVKDIGAGALVTDLAVLRLGREWRTKASFALALYTGDMSFDSRQPDVSMTVLRRGCKRLKRGNAAMVSHRHWPALANRMLYAVIRQPRVAECSQVAEKIDVPFHEVDAHNVVPVWEASDKRETGARTIRGKINRQLGDYLEVRLLASSCPDSWNLPFAVLAECELSDAPSVICNSTDSSLTSSLGWCMPTNNYTQQYSVQHVAFAAAANSRASLLHGIPADACILQLAKAAADGWVCCNAGVPRAAEAGQLERGHNAGAHRVGRPHRGGPGAREGGAGGDVAPAGRGRRLGGEPRSLERSSDRFHPRSGVCVDRASMLKALGTCTSHCT